MVESGNGTPRVIDVRHLHRAYRETVAVDDLSFPVRPGEILGLLGPNGAGKTTTMRAVAGVIPPTRGQIVVAGHDVVRSPVAAFEPRAERLLEQFELTEQRHTLAQELSRGMRQKVAICCAYLHEPRAILVDEPLTGLDPRGIRTMKASLRDRAARGAAIVISSHLLALVEDLCTHLLILHRGRQLFFGEAGHARAMFAATGTDSPLEAVFFRVTEGAPELPQPAL